MLRNKQKVESFAIRVDFQQNWKFHHFYQINDVVFGHLFYPIKLPVGCNFVLLSFLIITEVFFMRDILNFIVASKVYKSGFVFQ